jgi:Domain of unknown function (DUF6471)
LSNIRNKVARGGFSAAFFVQCLRAIGANRIDLTLYHVSGIADPVNGRIDDSHGP